MNNKITILMSTYNGEKYLKTQIDSILNSKDVNPKLIVRDDGSTDNTISILQQYQSANQLTLYKGNNLKSARSFMTLLQNAPDSDYYAFSDQDDYWLEDKLSIAIESISQFNESPALYFCQTQLVDKDLKKIKSTNIKPYLTFGEALIYQFIGGCTMVFNKKLKEIVDKYNPTFLQMHDIWIYGIAQAIGAKIIFDKNPHIYYRQHENNVIGQGYNIVEKWKRRYKRISHNKHERLKLALELHKGFYNIMPKENQDILNLAIMSGKGNFIRRFIAARDSRLKCAPKSTYILYRLSSLFKTY